MVFASLKFVYPPTWRAPAVNGSADCFNYVMSPSEIWIIECQQHIHIGIYRTFDSILTLKIIYNLSRIPQGTCSPPFIQHKYTNMYICVCVCVCTYITIYVYTHPYKFFIPTDLITDRTRWYIHFHYVVLEMQAVTTF